MDVYINSGRYDASNPILKPPSVTQSTMTMKRGTLHPFCSDWYQADLPSSLLIIGFTLFLSALLPSYAQAQLHLKPTVEWVKAIAGKDYNAGADIAVDTHGDILIAGVFRDQISLDNDPRYRFSNQGKTDIVLIKVDQAGDVLWMRTIGGPGEDRAFRIASDKAGNIFLTGSFEHVIRFDEDDPAHTLKSRGKEDIFLAKFTTNGEVLWSVQSGGERSDQGIGLAIDDQGAVYVTGYFEEHAIFGNERTLKSKGQLDAYIAKYHADGTLVWANELGGLKRDIASGVAIHPSGFVYITGVTRGPGPLLDLDNKRVRGAPHGQDDLFLARYSADGYLDQLAYAGGRGFDASNAINIDDQGNIYVVGYFEDEASIIDLKGSATSIRGQSFDLFVSKFDTEGKISWTRTAGGELWDNAYDIDVDAAGDIYVTGLFRKAADFSGNQETDIEGIGEANAFIAKYQSSGALAGIKRIEGAKSEGAGIATSTNGEVYLTGLFLQQAMFEERQETLTSTTFNSFIAKYDALGFNNPQPEELLSLLAARPTAVISANYPNPFSTQTSFEIELTETTQVRLVIHDALGRVLDELNNSKLASGSYQFAYDASRLARGTYFYTMETPSARVTRIMTLSR